MTEEASAIVPGRRHIIRRPRLTRLLNETNARIILLVAPAGYGKTTLAREWLEERGGRAAWYQTRRGSDDVAALAGGLAESLAEVRPEAAARVWRRVQAVDRPEQTVDQLARALREKLHALG